MTDSVPKYKLTYFDIDGGRGEVLRIAFHAAKIEFEDHRTVSYTHLTLPTTPYV